MNSDHILEVPDTPDRIQQSTCPVSSTVAGRDIAIAAANPFPRRRFIIKTGNNSIHSPSSQGNACSVPAPSDADLFKQAKVARVLKLSEDFEAKLSSQAFNRTTGTFSENEMRAGKRGLDQSSSTSNHISCSDTGGRSFSCQITEGEVSQRDAHHRNVDFLGVGSGLPTIPVGKRRNRTGSSTINRLKVVAGADACPGSSSGEVKGEAITNKAIAGPSSPPCVVPQRHVGQKKLVRNGCISPSNIAKRSVKFDGKQEMCSPIGVLHHPHSQLDVSGIGNVIDLTDNSPISTRHESTVNGRLISANSMDTRAAKRLRTDRVGGTSIPPSEYHANSSNCFGVSLSGRNNKGKEICFDFLDSKRIGEGNTTRVCPSAGGTSSVINNSSSGVNPEQGWRKTHNHTSKLPMSSMGSRKESGSSAPSDQDHRSAAGGNKNLVSGSTTRPESLGNKTLGIVRGRRKHASSSSHPGESSNALDEPRGSFLASSRTTAGRNHTTRRHDIPVITIDDTFPETRPSSSGYNNGTSVDPTIQAQLEADELLARQLQEQLYNEAPRVVPTEEIDAVIAMSLQHEEDAHRSSRAVRRSQYYTRGAQAPRSQAPRSNAYQDAVERTNNLISRLQTASSITSGLGAVFPRYPSGPHIQPNIDLNDYDALLALDENNHQHTGASESQINNLPQSVVQSNSIEEPCAVCLENPSVGDTIRHLPCFHKFHKDCIDEWLRRKKLCPICKSGIR